MKQTLLVFSIFILFSTKSFSQAPDIEMYKNLGGSDHDDIFNITQIDDNGYILAGVTQSDDYDVTQQYGFGDIWIVKLNLSGEIEWQKSLGGSYVDNGIVKKVSDGGFIVGGNTSSIDHDVSVNHGMQDMWAVKLDTEGEIEWEITLGGSDMEFFTDIIETSDHGFVVTGTTESSDGDISGYHGETDILIVKLSSSGEIEWKKTIGGSEDDVPQQILSLNSGFTILARTTSNDGDITWDIEYDDTWLISFNLSGDIIWDKVYEDSLNSRPLYFDVTSDGGYIISAVGYNNSNNGFHVIKANATGDMIWDALLEGSGEELAIVKELTDGSYILSGESDSTDGDFTANNGGSDLWVAKLSSTGQVEWSNLYGSTEGEYIPSDFLFVNRDNILSTDDGGFIVRGSTNNTEIGFMDILLIKINSVGELIWEKTLGGAKHDQSDNLFLTSDGKMVLAGMMEEAPGDTYDLYGNNDIMFLKLEVENLNVAMFDKHDMKIFPNPAITNLSFQLPNNSITGTLIITNTLGEKIMEADAVNTIDVSNFASGIYFVEVIIGHANYKGKFIKQ